MNQDWQTISFEECLSKVKTPNKIPKKKFLIQGIYPVISQEKGMINGYWDNEDDVFKVINPIVIYGDHTQVVKYVDHDFVMGADGVKILQPKSFIDSRYFYYYLRGYPVKSLGYARHYRLLKEMKVSYPPLPEQQRIVSILDEAFTAIDQAIANTEKNLANARELFESYLNNVFNQKGESWVNKNLKDILKLEYGKPLPKEDRDVDGKYPAYGANGVKCRTNKCYREGFGIIVGRKGSAGEVTLTEDGYWALDVTYYVDFDQEVYALMFLYYLLLSLKLQSLAKGVKPGINRNDVYAIESAFPPLTEQLCIVSKLDKLITETTKLESFYERKLASLKELKQSVLQKAFSGELTTEDIKHR